MGVVDPQRAGRGTWRTVEWLPAGRHRVESNNTEGATMLKGFRTFILRGNVVDLAIAVVLGVAFNAVITALVKDLFTPLIAAIIGKPDFSGLTFTINGSSFLYGDVINAILAFVAVAAVIYFVVVVPMNQLAARRAKGVADVSTRECPECLSTIPKAARRCSFCTVVVAFEA
jgi:large conductance mechanosensitive channel